MTVFQLAEWLLAFPDQGATVEVLSHDDNGGMYEQGGTCTTVVFDPTNLDHLDYTDFRGNPFVAKGMVYYNTRTLLLGEQL